MTKEDVTEIVEKLNSDVDVNNLTYRDKYEFSETELNDPSVVKFSCKSGPLGTSTLVIMNGDNEYSFDIYKDMFCQIITETGWDKTLFVVRIENEEEEIRIRGFLKKAA